MADTFIGFDSAWTDKAKAPGAICAVSLEANRLVAFHPPRLASFAEALVFVDEVRSALGCTLIALDQPTIVPNMSSMRPVERVAASLVSWLGGGVQPANRGKVGMFCDASPIWPFLKTLGAEESPEIARTATEGLHLIEVFPAISLPSLHDGFFGRLAGPRYNPARKNTFQLDHWRQVGATVAAAFEEFELAEPAAWCRLTAAIAAPTKADQDKLDAMICLVTALHWRLRARETSMMLGSLTEGYMVFPATLEVRQKLYAVAERLGVSAA